jgi:hypothetical protein
MQIYGGSGITNSGKLVIDASYDGRDYSIELQLPPLKCDRFQNFIKYHWNKHELKGRQY